MTANKTKRYRVSDENIDVEQELIDDFEEVNFGARSLESFDQDLAHGSEEIEFEEERKTKFFGHNKKIINKKVQESMEQTAGNLNVNNITKLYRAKPFVNVPTERHK